MCGTISRAKAYDVVPLYFATERPVIDRDGMLIMVDDDRLKLQPGETMQQRLVRFRTLGCYPLTGAIESSAATLEEIIAEMRASRSSERQGRLIDHDGSSLDGAEEAGGLFLMHGGLATPAPLRAPAGPAPADKPLLRFITCGSVDDGKSTLIGRLLYDADLAADDLIAALEKDSKKHGTQGDDLDFALLVDGLAAEREQGITIDVAYRYFATEKRKFIVADTPGHEQYTRNMATGASTAELAVLLVDARRGLLDQTRRHSVIVSMLGVRHVVVAVNKMDLVSYSQEIFDAIERDFRAFAEHLRFLTIAVIPLVAKDGDNLVHASKKMDWYSGPPLLAYLENVAPDDNARVLPFRFPVQWVNRPTHDFRGFSGFIAGGNVKPGDIVRILPSGRDTTIARIVTYDGDLAHAVAGQSVTLTLTEEIDISRGDMLVSPVSPAKIGDRLSAKLLWLVREPLTLDKSYLLKLGARTTPAFVKTGRLAHRDRERPRRAAHRSDA